MTVSGSLLSPWRAMDMIPIVESTATAKENRDAHGKNAKARTSHLSFNHPPFPPPLSLYFLFNSLGDEG
jgi:hypothetical protein